MVRTTFICLLATALAISGCRKEYQPNTETSISLFIKGDIDGVNLNLEAGREDVIQRTASERNNAGVFEFKAQFDNVDSQGGAFEVILLDDDRYLPGREVHAEDIVLPGIFDWATTPPLTDPQKLQFYSPYPSNANLSWVINGETTNEEFPTYVFSELGSLTATLEVTDGSCTDELTRTLAIFNDDVDYFYYDTFSWKYEPDNAVTFTFDDYDPTIHGSVEWRISDDTSDLVTGNGAEFNFTFEEVGPHTVTMQVVYIETNYPSIFATRVDPSGESDCLASFEFEQFPLNLEDQTSKAVVRYILPNGDVYQSYHPDGITQEGNFNIIDVQDYFNDIEGTNTLLATFTANCTLFNINDINDTKQLHVESGSAAFPLISF